MNASAPHIPVLYQQVLEALHPQAGGRYVDGTLGAGGHAQGILQASRPDGLLLGLDVDPQALAIAKERLHPFGERVILRQASYTSLQEVLQSLGWHGVDGILLDLGVSSMQLDTAERGFSFRQDAPLDMRFSPSSPQTAADLVNTLPEADLADILYRYGEERRARQVARAIVAARPLYTTRQLAEVVARATRSGKPGIHPATRTFQALRMAVNQELQNIERVLPQAVEALNTGGRLAIISFHSLEDRIVKHYLRRESRDCVCPPEQPICTCQHKAALRILTRKPVTATDEECAQNPRARSAKLRVAEKLPATS
ncbi:MAG: 16S rRNA (cytosine(1402)-N(4))-methyltransferase RsmH [Anaerolineae bacterium]|nr:MAG: 16S rRNA (cytosine(1402)-N(4))-methyltransferase RsmH [Anaerolineae bacterium]